MQEPWVGGGVTLRQGRGGRCGGGGSEEKGEGGMGKGKGVSEENS